MSVWDDVDSWREQNNPTWTPRPRRQHEVFAVVEFPKQHAMNSHRDRRFLSRGSVVIAVKRRAMGLRSRGWCRKGSALGRDWMEAHSNTAWEGVSLTELLVALDSWLEAGSPQQHPRRVRRLTPVTR